MRELQPLPAGHAEYTCPLPYMPEAVAAMRRRAGTVLGRWAIPATIRDDAILVISELTTNAISYALPPAVLRLSMPDSEDRTLRVEVTDGGPAPTPQPAPVTPEPALVVPEAVLAECGRGMGIIAALAVQHGVSYHAARVTRWAELAVTP